MRIFCTLILILISLTKLYSQSIDPNILLSKIQNRIFKHPYYSDIYVDLDKKSILSIDHEKNTSKEEFFNFMLTSHHGSFLNKNNLEYLLVIKIDEISSFFGHAGNWGNTTLIFLFDENLSQIGEIYSQDHNTEFIEVIDIDNNGLSEVIMKSYYGHMGCSQEWVMIFCQNFNEPSLTSVTHHDCENTGIPGEIITLNSKYSVQNKKITFFSKLDYLISFGMNEDTDETDVRIIKSEDKVDTYELIDGKFIHLKSELNVNWDDERLGF